MADSTEETVCGEDGTLSREYGSATRGGYGEAAMVLYHSRTNEQVDNKFLNSEGQDRLPPSTNQCVCLRCAPKSKHTVRWRS